MHPDDEPADNPRIEPLEPASPRRLGIARLAGVRWLGSVMTLCAVAVLIAVVVAAPSTGNGANTNAHTSSGDAATQAPLPSPTPVDPAVYLALTARPLRLPAVASLAACPAAPGRQIIPDASSSDGTTLLHVALESENGLATYAPPEQWGDGLGWGGIPLALWIFQSNFAGPVVVRGERLDAPGIVEFNLPEEPLRTVAEFDVQTRPGTSLQLEDGYYIRFNAPGCYGLQVDWSGGTEEIIFQAV